MKKNEAKFKAYDWDEGAFKLLPTNNIVEAIYTAWNYEFPVYEADTEYIIFSGMESNEVNSEWLEPYGLKLIDTEFERKLQNIETGEIYSAEWQG